MQSMGAQLAINDSTIQAGMQIFKLAAMSNFIQGRRMDMVAAVCLYSACRKTSPCKVMLIDFADLVQVSFQCNLLECLLIILGQCLQVGPHL